MSTRLFIRFVFFVILFLSGLAKLVDPSPAENTIFLLLDLTTHTQILVGILIKVLAVFEISLAVLLLVKRDSISVIYTTLSLFIFFTIIILLLLLLKIDVENCGCFGQFIPNGNLIVTLLRNVIFCLLLIYYIYTHNLLRK